MVIITFPDETTEKKAIGFLLGRFSGTVLKSGEHILPETAMAALARKNIPFTVHGIVSCEKQVAGPELEANLNEVAGAAVPIQPQDDWERQLLALAKDCGVSLPDSALRRESLYD